MTSRLTICCSSACSLIIGFAYFYTAITFDPVKQADTIRKQGGFIARYPPRAPDRALPGQDPVRITLPGALFIAAVALVPAVVILGLNTVLDSGQRWAFDRLRRSASRSSSPSGVASRDDEADRQPADDAELRGFPEVSHDAAGMVILIFGPAGLGQGHPVAILASSTRTAVVHVSTGDMLRAAVAEGTELGRWQGQGHHGRLATCRARRGHVRNRRIVGSSDSDRRGQTAVGYCSTASPEPRPRPMHSNGSVPILRNRRRDRCRDQSRRRRRRSHPADAGPRGREDDTVPKPSQNVAWNCTKSRDQARCCRGSTSTSLLAVVDGLGVEHEVFGRLKFR